MAIIFSHINLSNPLKNNEVVKTAGCVVNKRLYTHLIITKKIAQELEFEEIEKRQVKIGDGPAEIYSYVGPVQVEFKGRIGFTGALVDNSDDAIMCYIGSIVMNDLDLMVLDNPLIKLDINPGSILSTK